MKIVECGLYIIKDEYFSKYDSGFMMDNKHESRPFYCGIKLDSGIYWMVPISSQVEKYKKKIKSYEETGKECIFYYIAKLKGKDSVFLIGDSIPCTEEYVLRSFLVESKPFIIQDKKDIKIIRSRLSRFLSLVRQGKLSPIVDILGIEENLIKRFE